MAKLAERLGSDAATFGYICEMAATESARSSSRPSPRAGSIYVPLRFLLSSPFGDWRGNDRRLTTPARSFGLERPNSSNRYELKNLERARRIERPTLTLARLCSTPELRPRSKWTRVMAEGPGKVKWRQVSRQGKFPKNFKACRPFPALPVRRATSVDFRGEGRPRERTAQLDPPLRPSAGGTLQSHTTGSAGALDADTVIAVVSFSRAIERILPPGHARLTAAARSALSAAHCIAW
jgi:hypothetical protein